MTALPIRPGDRGEAVRDLQQRLGGLDLEMGGDVLGVFGPGTAEAVRSFQTRYGLDVGGHCDQLTWTVLVEAGYRLGDRQLYHRSPMMRGDDIADLQRRLGALGFDAGRADGIFGPLTAAAVAEFQRNVGLTSDGICGPATVAALHRLGDRRTAGVVTVAQVRERELLRCRPRQLRGRRVAVGHSGGLGALVQAVHRLLRDAGAVSLLLHHPDGSVQAQQANDFEADVFLSVRISDESAARAAYFRGASFESTPGRHLAGQVIAQVAAVLEVSGGEAVGMRLPVLRETRMPAVVAEVGPPGVVVARNEDLARALAAALAAWTEEPVPAATTPA